MFADVIVDRVISLDRLAGVSPEAFQNVVFHQATFHIPVVDVGDLELAATRRLQARQPTPHGFVVEIRAGDRELAGWILRLFDDSLDALASVEVSNAEVPEVLAILLSRQHDARSGRLLAERIDAALQGSAEDVVREEHHGAAATREAHSFHCTRDSTWGTSIRLELHGAASAARSSEPGGAARDAIEPSIGTRRTRSSRITRSLLAGRLLVVGRRQLAARLFAGSSLEVERPVLGARRGTTTGSRRRRRRAGDRAGSRPVRARHRHGGRDRAGRPGDHG